MLLKCKQCDWLLAKVSEKGLIRMTRKSAKTIIHGVDYTVVMDCPKCLQETIVEVWKGELKKEDLKLEVDKDEAIDPVDPDLEPEVPEPVTPPEPAPVEPPAPPKEFAITQLQKPHGLSK